MGIDQIIHGDTALSGLSPAAVVAERLKPLVPFSAIDIQRDINAISIWLAEYHARPNTFGAYRRQAVRLIGWMSQRGLTLHVMDRAAWMMYERDLATILSTGSVANAISIISGMMDYLVGTDYLEANPLHLRRKARRVRENRVHRYLDAPAWEAVRQYLATASQHDDPEHERARFAIIWMVLMGPRASEMTSAMMSDVYAIRRGGKAQWWWRIIGKGDAEASIPVAEAAMDALIRYRIHLGLTALPGHHDQRPLIQHPGGSAKPISRTTLHRIIKTTLSAAADHAETAEVRARMMSASTHWLRHTAASRAVDAGIDIVDVARLLRHQRIETTMRYIHRDADRLHDVLHDRGV